MIDYYELLGITKNASDQEIKNAYRKMAKKYHPDVNKNEEANKIIISLNEAKETLLDSKKRREYDLLLEEIKYSKQVSKNKEETYRAKTQEYKETYSETYITKWQFFINYFKNSIDKKWIKFFKTILVTCNYLLFAIIKLVSLAFVYFLCLIESFVDYAVGIIMILAFLSLFVLSAKDGPDYVSFIPGNVENFLLLSFVGITIELIKTFIIEGSVNLFVLLQNIEDKIFVYILMK